MTGLARPTPYSWSVGDVITQALLNGIRDALTFAQNPPMFLGTQATIQSLGNGSLTAVALDSTVVDSYGGHSTTVNNTRYTPQQAGWYLFLGMVSFASNSSGGRDAEFHKNGSSAGVAQGSGQGAAGSINTTVVNWALVQCNGSTDYIELYAYQTSGGSLNTVISNTGVASLFVHA